MYTLLSPTAVKYELIGPHKKFSALAYLLWQSELMIKVLINLKQHKSGKNESSGGGGGGGGFRP